MFPWRAWHLLPALPNRGYELNTLTLVPWRCHTILLTYPRCAHTCPSTHPRCTRAHFAAHCTRNCTHLLSTTPCTHTTPTRPAGERARTGSVHGAMVKNYCWPRSGSDACLAGRPGRMACNRCNILSCCAGQPASDAPRHFSAGPPSDYGCRHWEGGGTPLSSHAQLPVGRTGQPGGPGGGRLAAVQAAQLIGWPSATGYNRRGGTLSLP